MPVCYTPLPAGWLPNTMDGNDLGLFGERKHVMANIKSQKKRIITNEKRRQRNVAVRSRMKTVIKQAMTAIEAKDEAAKKTALPAAISAIDRAESKGVIHANSAGRKKAMLHRAATR